MPIARILGKNGAQQTRIIEEKLKKKKETSLTMANKNCDVSKWHVRPSGNRLGPKTNAAQKIIVRKP